MTIQQHQVIHVPRHGLVNLLRYESLADMARDCHARTSGNAMKFARRTPENDTDWSEFEKDNGWHHAVQEAINGNPKLGQTIARNMLALPPVDSLTQRWSNSVAGAFPDVARYCAGMPDAMRTRRAVADERAPLRIIAHVGSSASVTREELQQRGAAILALAANLASVRPITLTTMALFQMNDGRAACCTVEVSASPLDMTLAGTALCSQRVIRGLMYSALVSTCSNGKYGSLPWAFGIVPTNERGAEQFSKLTRDILGMDDEEPAIIIPGAHSQHPAVHDTQAWLASMLSEYMPEGKLAAAA